MIPNRLNSEKSDAKTRAEKRGPSETEFYRFWIDFGPQMGSQKEPRSKKRASKMRTRKKDEK
jgi:hypothetical protein